MEPESWPQGHVKQLVRWCDELSELQALENFLATALADAEDSHCQHASLLAGQLQRRLQQLRGQMQLALSQLRDCSAVAVGTPGGKKFD